MKKRLLSLLLVLALLVSLAPTALPRAQAVTISSADRTSLENFLARFWWYWYPYNCTDAARVNEADVYWRYNLLGGLLSNGYPIDYKLYNNGNWFYENWRGSDPLGRWDAYTRVSAEGARWILKNIFHCTDADVNKMHARLLTAKYHYYYNGYYYACLGGVGGGAYTRNLQFTEYGDNRYLANFYYEDVTTKEYSGPYFAVVSKERIDGKDYWTLYYHEKYMAPSTTGFLDVNDDSFYAAAVEWAVNKGITSGVSSYRFDPSGTCTRAQAVTFLWRAAGSPAPKSKTCPFTDVAAGTFYYNAVLWAVENQITNGMSATLFQPNGPCTRGQIVTFLWRAAGRPKTTGSLPFRDLAPGAYYTEPIRWAVSMGITNGTDGTTFSPNLACNRAQMVTFLYRWLQKDHVDPGPVDWLGLWQASTGETIRVTEVTRTTVTFTETGYTASGQSTYTNTYTLRFTDTARTVVQRPYAQYLPQLQYTYTLDAAAGCLRLKNPLNGRVTEYYRAG